jgi:hypothetical protein
MILIPFFWNTADPDWIEFGVFLCSAGRQFWSVADTDTDSELRGMLSENGFPTLEIKHKPDCIFAEIDRQAIKLSNFYLWSEVDPKVGEEDVWRIYRIPKALWSDPVFKEHWWRTSGILPLSSPLDEITG